MIQNIINYDYIILLYIQTHLGSVGLLTLMWNIFLFSLMC